MRSQGAADPDDLLGEVFLQVARDIGRFRGDGTALRRWIFTIAHHRLIDDRRRRARRPPPATGGLLSEPVAPPHPDPVDPELLEALAALTPDQRQVVTLRFLGDLSLEDVAKITGRRVGAVKALQHRGLEQLERLLGRRSPDFSDEPVSPEGAAALTEGDDRPAQ